MFFIVFERNWHDCQIKTSKYIDSRVKIERDLNIFRSLSRTGGENKMYKLMSAATRSEGRNTDMNHFISYVFIEDEIIMYDDKSVMWKIDENLSSNVKFQREVCAVTYCLDHFPSTFLDEQANECEQFDWSVTTKTNEYISKIFLKRVT